MEETPYDQIDELFAKIRLLLLKVRQIDPTTAEDMRSLLAQLEDYVESQFIEYLKLENQESKKMQAYCMKCRAKSEMKNAKSMTMKNGRPATQGICSVCGTRMFRMGKSKK